MRCHYVWEKGQKIFVSACYGAMYDDNAKNCTCEAEHQTFEQSVTRLESYKEKIDELFKENKDLRKEITRLVRILNNVNKRGGNVKIYSK